MTCEDTRDHLESCEDCRLHVAVEARLRTLPVLDPPKGLVSRVLRALPREAPLRREILRLAAAAAVLFAVAGSVFAFQLDRHERVVSAREQAARSVGAALETLNAWRVR
ncbi:MAG TPA: hypothetical protein VF950_18610 [Planctomycetota bacterium]